MKHKARKLGPPEPDPDAGNDAILTRAMTPLEAALFIESMSAELRIMARQTKLTALAYFLEMARIEASAEIERLAEAREKDR